MSQEQIQVEEKTQQLLAGPLKHVRAAALAAALVPLASVVATPVAAQDALCGSGGICGFVFNDVNNNGIQDAGEPGITGAVVSIGDNVTATDSNGFYYFLNSWGEYQVVVQIPPNSEPSPSNVGTDDTIDSDGVSDNLGNSVATVTLEGSDSNTDFGFHQLTAQAPGTGTPGYWKTHPEAWPVPGITVGGVYYSKAVAISWLDQVGKDKTTTMFSSLVSAKLNVLLGNNATCVSSTITLADDWMLKYGPVGKGVAASSLAWKIGEPYHRLMDNYNNGMLCAAHRN